MTLKEDVLFAKEQLYDKLLLQLTDYKEERESKEYNACSFKLNGKSVLSRKAKITPKKVGQFVTIWKRINGGPIQPFDDTDAIDYVVVNVSDADNAGQFVFPKEVLIKQGVISTKAKEGKRAIRVYPPWERAINKQAQKTQQWQQAYFLAIPIDVDKARRLFT